jgi:hypothetical protein
VKLLPLSRKHFLRKSALQPSGNFMLGAFDLHVSGQTSMGRSGSGGRASRLIPGHFALQRTW